MKTGRILIAAAAVTIFNTIVNMITCGGMFRWVYSIEPTNVWKPTEGAPGLLFYAGDFILSMIIVFVYAVINKGIPGNNRYIKGLAYGLGVWAVGTLPGMFATYLFMTVATTVVAYWTVMGLLQTPLNGLIIATIYGE